MGAVDGFPHDPFTSQCPDEVRRTPSLPLGVPPYCMPRVGHIMITKYRSRHTVNCKWLDILCNKLSIMRGCLV